MAIGENGQLLKAAVVFGGYYVLFKRLIAILFFLADRRLASGMESEAPAGNGRKTSWYFRKLEEAPFWTVFLTLAILYLPHCCISYPASFMGDTPDQIVQAFPELKNSGLDYVTEERLLSDSVYLNAHHSVAHTMLLHGFLLFGRSCFHSFNVGIFLFVLLQALFLLASVAHSVAVLVREGILRAGFALLVVAWCFCHPVLHNYIFLATKDVFYAAFILLFTTQLFLVLRGRRDRKTHAGLAIASLGMVLFRNESKFILVLFFFLAWLFFRQRKVFLVFSGGVLLASVCIFDVLYPALCINPGSVREALSIPFQQTARYVSCHKNEVTDGEKQAIDAVLDYHAIGKRYDAGLSDPVKLTFREESTGEDMRNYLRVWMRMFFKHPDTCIQATLNNYYQFFHPGTARADNYDFAWSVNQMKTANKQIKSLGMAFSYPEATGCFRDFGDRIFGFRDSLPGFSLLLTPAVYTWILLLALFYSIHTANRASIVLLLPALLNWLKCLAGPYNAYYMRYSYPLVFILPLLLGMLWILHKKHESPEGV